MSFRSDPSARDNYLEYIDLTDRSAKIGGVEFIVSKERSTEQSTLYILKTTDSSCRQYALKIYEGDYCQDQPQQVRNTYRNEFNCLTAIAECAPVDGQALRFPVPVCQLIDFPIITERNVRRICGNLFEYISGKPFDSIYN